jgi:serine/threonine protein kinase
VTDLRINVPLVVIAVIAEPIAGGDISARVHAAVDTFLRGREESVSADSRVGRMFGHYRIIGLLGRGGMGEVYEAEDTRKGRTVALKILPEQYSQDERFRARFQRESRAAAILQEQHVIPIHDWGEIDGNLYIDMRLVQGATLHELLQKGPLEPARAAHVVSEISSALDAAHAAGLVHRDVKPQNIIVTASDFPYLVDFGIAEASGDSGLTMTGTNIGTLSYMAPERFGDGDATPAVDVYALACVLHEALTGDTPFLDGSMERAIAAHLTSAPPRPSAINPRVPPAFDAVIARGMAKDPRSRYPSASALGRAALEAVSGGPQYDHYPPTTYEQAEPPTALAPSVPPTAYAPVPPTAYAASPPPYAAPPPASPPRYAPPPVYDAEPDPPAAPSRGWVMPAVVVAIVVLLGAVGVLIGLVLSRSTSDEETAKDGPPRTLVDAPGGSGSGSGGDTDTSEPKPPPTPTETPLNQGAPPPMISGPDKSASHQSCDDGFRVNGAGPGTQSRRGSPDTSCFFAQSVLTSYWNQYGNASRDLRTVYAPGAVDCRTVATGNLCRGADFVMTCQARPGNAYITCEGGRDARVYLY